MTVRSIRPVTFTAANSPFSSRPQHTSDGPVLSVVVVPGWFKEAERRIDERADDGGTTRARVGCTFELPDPALFDDRLLNDRPKWEEVDTMSEREERDALNTPPNRKVCSEKESGAE